MSQTSQSFVNVNVNIPSYFVLYRNQINLTPCGPLRLTFFETRIIFLVSFFKLFNVIKLQTQKDPTIYSGGSDFACTIPLAIIRKHFFASTNEKFSHRFLCYIKF